MPGLGTGADTQKVIQQLIEVERRPLKRIILDNESSGQSIKIWEEARRRSRNLQDKSQVLYSFSGAFATKAIVSSDPGAVTGQASPDMDDQSMQIEVSKLATHHRIHSAPVSAEKDLPAGTFTIKVGEKSLEYDFPGGKLTALVRLIKSKAAGTIDVNMIRKDSETSIVVLRSLTSGTKGKMEFVDAGVLATLGLPPGAGGASEVEAPQDAVLKLHGVEVTRTSNENITDVLEGASLTLRKVTTGPVTLTVQANTSVIEKQIADWITAYNELMQFLRENSKTVSREEFERNRPEGDDVGEGLRRLKASSGLFTTDSNVRQLMFGLQGIVAASYPNSRPNGVRVLADIGISSTAISRGEADPAAGLLMLDADKLRSALSQDAAAVKDIFASDTNEDSVIDNGAAFRMQQMLAPYTRMSGGLITTRIDLIKSQISDNKEKIRRKEMELVGKEAELRRRFGRMDSAIRESKNMSQSLGKLGEGQ